MATYELISSNTVGAGGAATVTFSSIPSTYTDLKLVMSTRAASSSADWIDLSLNSSSGVTGFSAKWLSGSGTASGAGTNNIEVAVYTPSVATANVFGVASIYFAGYTSSNYKPYQTESTTENNGTAAYAHLVSGLWSNTAAINSISLIARSTTFVQYSTFYLYGIKNS